MAKTRRQFPPSSFTATARSLGGKDAHEAVHNSVVLEKVALMNFHSLQLNLAQTRMQQELLDKHYLRNHGKNVYYGQA